MIAVVMQQRFNALRKGELYHLSDGFANALIRFNRAIPFDAVDRDTAPESAAIEPETRTATQPKAKFRRG